MNLEQSIFENVSRKKLDLDLKKLYSDKKLLHPDWIFLQLFLYIWTSPDIASGLVQIWDMD